jgi:hypothetical protein
MERSYRLTLDDVLATYGDLLLVTHDEEGTALLVLYGQDDDDTRLQVEFGWSRGILEYLDTVGSVTLNDGFRWRRIIVQQRREGKCVESIFTTGTAGEGVAVSYAMYPWVSGTGRASSEGGW